MIGYIQGKIAHISGEYALIDNQGIGYKIYMPSTQLTQLPKVGEEGKVYTYLYIREGILDLYGFSTEEGLKTFELLITVSGVGPKAAMAVLSALTPTDFAIAVTNSDYKSISRAQGVGGKTAQRIVLELQDKLKKQSIASGGPSEAAPAADSESNSFNEAVNALMVLGYSYLESKQALAGEAGDSTEELIKQALKKLM